MSRRETLFLGIALLVLAFGAWAYIAFRPSEPQTVAPPFFYELDPEGIVRVEVGRSGDSIAFVWNEAGDEWRFENEPDVEPDPDRWGGMPFLLTGPRIERELPAATDLAPFGLQPASMTVDIGSEAGDTLRVLVGKTTPDGSSHYVMQADTSTVVLVDRAWADVISRLVTDPPYPPT